MSKFNPSDFPKFRKWHDSGRKIGALESANVKERVNFASLISCDYGIVALEDVKLTPNQLEAVRKVIVRHMGKDCVLNFRVFAHTPVTQKPLAVRMGGGVGAPTGWECFVRSGTVILELDGKDSKLVQRALKDAAHKLPCKIRILSRLAFGGEGC